MKWAESTLNPFHSVVMKLNSFQLDTHRYKTKKKRFLLPIGLSSILSLSVFLFVGRWNRRSDKNQTVVYARVPLETVNTFDETRIEMRSSIPFSALEASENKRK